MLLQLSLKFAGPEQEKERTRRIGRQTRRKPSEVGNFRRTSQSLTRFYALDGLDDDHAAHLPPSRAQRADAALSRCCWARRATCATLREQGEIMPQITRTLTFLLLLTGATAHAQSGPDAPSPSTSDPPAPAFSGSTAANGYRGYTFPDRKQQFRNYLYYTFGPPAFISTAIGAGLDQNKPAPPEWDSGAQGYGERYGWRFGMNMVTQTTEYSLGSVMHEDIAFHRCQCSGFFPRSAHAVISTLTA